MKDTGTAIAFLGALICAGSYWWMLAAAFSARDFGVGALVMVIGLSIAAVGGGLRKLARSPINPSSAATH